MTTSHHYLMFFTNMGKVYRMKAYEIPEAGRTARGTAIINLLQLQPDEKITAVIPIREYKEGNYLFMATKNGIVKKTPITDYANVRKTGLAAINLRDDDQLIEVKKTDNNKDIILVTKFGQCIRFHETDVRSTGRTSMGVIGMNLTDGDEVVGMQMNHAGRRASYRFRKRSWQGNTYDRIYTAEPWWKRCEVLQDHRKNRKYHRYQGGQPGQRDHAHHNRGNHYPYESGGHFTAWKSYLRCEADQYG